jgi:hypothetical protein
MKKLYSGALVFFVLGSVLIQGNISGNQIFEESLPRVGQMYVPGEFLVKFKPNVSEQTINTLNSTHGVSNIYTSPYTGFRRLRTPEGETVADMVEISGKFQRRICRGELYGLCHEGAKRRTVSPSMASV